MWSITKLTYNEGDLTKIYCCDGLPLFHTERGPEGHMERIMVGNLGYIDIADTGHLENGPYYWSLSINDAIYWYEYEAELEIAIEPDGSFRVEGDDNKLELHLKELPKLEDNIIQQFHEMIDLKIVPYLDPPVGVQKTDEQFQMLAEKYFPQDDYGFEKAIALYDWTSPNSIRQELFSLMQYTGIAGLPLDLRTMARVIWNCRFSTDSIQGEDFMNAFMLQTAASEEAIYQQLCQVYRKLQALTTAEMKLYAQAILSLNYPSVDEFPTLYRSAVPELAGYNTEDFAPSLYEYPGNWGPQEYPLIQNFEEALFGALSPGSIITSKAPWTFSNDWETTKASQNGILITCKPPEDATVWPGCANITEFSLNPEKFEINMPPPCRYRIDSYEWIDIEQKAVCHFTLTLLGYCAEPIQGNDSSYDINWKRTKFRRALELKKV